MRIAVIKLMLLNRRSSSTGSEEDGHDCHLEATDTTYD